MYKISTDKRYEKFLNTPSFSERYSSLLNSNKKNVIYIKEEFEPSTFRYRAYNVEETFRDSKKYYVSYFLTSEIPNLYELIDKLDIVIFQRSKWTIEIESFITMLKYKGVKTAFDVDDAIYKTKYIKGYMESIGDNSKDNLKKKMDYAESLDKVASRVDFYITTNDYLKKKLESDYNKKVYVFHNYINKEQEEVAKKIVKDKSKLYDDSKFVIGYFSGSYSHNKDLKVVEDTLVKLLKKYDDTYILIVGLMKLSDELNEFKEQGRVIFDPYVPYEELEYKIASVDVNIIPLQMNDFNECKSELKYFEASIVNTPTVACNNGTYGPIINNKIDGYLCNEDEWLDTLEYIYNNREESVKASSKACSKCLDIYGYKNQLKLIENIYDDILKK